MAYLNFKKNLFEIFASYSKEEILFVIGLCKDSEQNMRLLYREFGKNFDGVGAKGIVNYDAREVLERFLKNMDMVLKCVHLLKKKKNDSEIERLLKSKTMLEKVDFATYYIRYETLYDKGLQFNSQLQETLSNQEIYNTISSKINSTAADVWKKTYLEEKNFDFEQVMRAFSISLKEYVSILDSVLIKFLGIPKSKVEGVSQNTKSFTTPFKKPVIAFNLSKERKEEIQSYVLPIKEKPLKNEEKFIEKLNYSYSYQVKQIYVYTFKEELKVEDILHELKISYKEYINGLKTISNVHYSYYLAENPSELKKIRQDRFDTEKKNDAEMNLVVKSEVVEEPIKEEPKQNVKQEEQSFKSEKVIKKHKSYTSIIKVIPRELLKEMLPIFTDIQKRTVILRHGENLDKELDFPNDGTSRCYYSAHYGNARKKVFAFYESIKSDLEKFDTLEEQILFVREKVESIKNEQQKQKVKSIHDKISPVLLKEMLPILTPLLQETVILCHGENLDKELEWSEVHGIQNHAYYDNYHNARKKVFAFYESIESDLEKLDTLEEQIMFIREKINRRFGKKNEVIKETVVQDEENLSALENIEQVQVEKEHEPIKEEQVEVQSITNVTNEVLEQPESMEFVNIVVKEWPKPDRQSKEQFSENEKSEVVGSAVKQNKSSILDIIPPLLLKEMFPIFTKNQQETLLLCHGESLDNELNWQNVHGFQPNYIYQVYYHDARKKAFKFYEKIQADLDNFETLENKIEFIREKVAIFMKTKDKRKKSIIDVIPPVLLKEMLPIFLTLQKETLILCHGESLDKELTWPEVKIGKSSNYYYVNYSNARKKAFKFYETIQADLESLETIEEQTKFIRQIINKKNTSSSENENELDDLNNSNILLEENKTLNTSSKIYPDALILNTYFSVRNHELVLQGLAITEETLIDCYIRNLHVFPNIEEVLDYILHAKVNYIPKLLISPFFKDFRTIFTFLEQQLIYLKLLAIRDPLVSDEKISEILGLDIDTVKNYQIMVNHDNYLTLDQYIRSRKLF